MSQNITLRPFVEAPASSIKVPQIDLAAIDLSSYVEGPQGRESRVKLAKSLKEALVTYGFFKLVGHGVEEETFDKLKSLTQGIFEAPQEEKVKFLAGEQKYAPEADRELGVVRGTGYKPRGHWEFQNKQKDNVEFYNVRQFLHDDIFYNEFQYPGVVEQHLTAISAYFKYLHNVVLRKILTLIDIILELPEDHLWENHFKVINNDIENSGGGFGRFLLYHEVNKEYTEKTNGTWLRGHTDATALTFIASQPIASLQIRDHDTDEWKYVTHTPNALVVNIGDAFKLLTGGYFKSSIHRVVTPPEDQLEYKRNTIIYFSDPSLSTVIDPETLDSPILNRLGYFRPQDLNRVTFKEWDEEKGKYLNSKSKIAKKEVTLFGRDTLMSLETVSAPLTA